MYGCVVGRKDHLVRKEGGGFDAQEYEEFPERYASVFSIKVSRLPGIDHDDIQGKKSFHKHVFINTEIVQYHVGRSWSASSVSISSVFLKC